MSQSIDLNCDMGESYGAWTMGNDAAVLAFVSSANIACGFHGGDPATLRKTVAAALSQGVALGAHPSLQDLAGFGRRAIPTTPEEAYDIVVYQIGALAGGFIMSRWTLYRSLMVFGLLQAVSNLGYWLIAVSPKSIWLMASAVGLENLCGGLGTASFVGLLMALCRQRFSATQFALLSALSAVGRTYLAGPLTPPLVEHLGWPGFFLVTVVIALPGLVLLRMLRSRIEAMIQNGDT